MSFQQFTNRILIVKRTRTFSSSCLPTSSILWKKNCSYFPSTARSYTKIRNKHLISRPFSTVATNQQLSTNNNEDDIFTDVYGRKLKLFHDPLGKKQSFYYDPMTFDSFELLLTSKDKPQYATSWEDPNFPGWVQFIDASGKRPYYMDRANPLANVQWAPPSDPSRDIFAEELEQNKKPLTKVPDDLPGAPLGKRFAAFLVDIGLSLGAGAGFGLLVYLDLGRILDAAQGFGFSSWVFFMMRDSVFERGTRSPGKKVMGLEIVKMDGQLPTRWNTAFRQAYLPIYTGATLLLPYIVLLPIADLGLVLFTKRSYRIGDLIGRTRVITEQTDREQRFKEKCSREDADDAKD